MYTLTAENKYGERLELTHNPSYDITEIEWPLSAGGCHKQYENSWHGWGCF